MLWMLLLVRLENEWVSHLLGDFKGFWKSQGNAAKRNTVFFLVSLCYSTIGWNTFFWIIDTTKDRGTNKCSHSDKRLYITEMALNLIWAPTFLVPKKMDPLEIWSSRNLIPEKFGPRETWFWINLVPPWKSGAQMRSGTISVISW